MFSLGSVQSPCEPKHRNLFTPAQCLFLVLRITSQMLYDVNEYYEVKLLLLPLLFTIYHIHFNTLFSVVLFGFNTASSWQQFYCVSFFCICLSLIFVGGVFRLSFLCLMVDLSLQNSLQISTFIRWCFTMKSALFLLTILFAEGYLGFLSNVSEQNCELEGVIQFIVADSCRRFPRLALFSISYII